MRIQDVLADQLATSHQEIAGTIGDVSESILHKAYEGGTINNVATIYAHTAFMEDYIVNTLLQRKPALYQEHGWEARLGIKMPANPAQDISWTEGLRMDLDEFDQYAKSAFAHSEAYVRNLSDAELERRLHAFGRDQTVAGVIASVLANHTPTHTGEIAALKGVHGLMGLPF